MSPLVRTCVYQVGKSSSLRTSIPMSAAPSIFASSFPGLVVARFASCFPTAALPSIPVSQTGESYPPATGTKSTFVSLTPVETR